MTDRQALLLADVGPDVLRPLSQSEQKAVLALLKDAGRQHQAIADLWQATRR